MFARLGLHRANHRQLVGDAGTTWHQFAKVDARELGGNAFEGSAVNAAGFGVPRFELAGGAAKPEQNTVLAALLCVLRESREGEEAAPTHHGERPGSRQALKEQAPM